MHCRSGQGVGPAKRLFGNPPRHRSKAGQLEADLALSMECPNSAPRSKRLGPSAPRSGGSRADEYSLPARPMEGENCSAFQTSRQGTPLHGRPPHVCTGEARALKGLLRSGEDHRRGPGRGLDPALTQLRCSSQRCTPSPRAPYHGVRAWPSLDGAESPWGSGSCPAPRGAPRSRPLSLPSLRTR